MKKCKACGKEINEGHMLMFTEYGEIYEMYFCSAKHCLDEMHGYGDCNVAIFKGEEPPVVIGYLGPEGLEDDDTVIFWSMS
jgi:hypothetical protein